MKERPMSLQTWSTTLLIEPSQNDLALMRLWIEDNGLPVLSRNSDVVAKFVRGLLLSNASWHGVHCDFVVQLAIPVQSDRPHDGLEWYGGHRQYEPRNSLSLAVRGFAALMVLACIGLTAFRYFALTPHLPVSWYNTGHA